MDIPSFPNEVSECLKFDFASYGSAPNEPQSHGLAMHSTIMELMLSQRGDTSMPCWRE